MSLTLGEKLRQAREERGIRISEVSEQTRISSLYLDAIENDNYKPLPGGIFNKGFVKSYAKFIGFDEQEALAEYAKLVVASEGSEDDHLRSYRPEVLTDDRNGASIVPTVIFAGVILTLMTAGVLFLVRYIQNRPETPVTVANTSNTNTVNVADPSVSEQKDSQGTTPTMETVKIEFRTTGEDISLTASSDGRKTYQMVTASKPAAFEPKQQLRLSYSRSKVRAAEMLINGKAITLPTEPENPRRAAIEVDINKDNLVQIWENGALASNAAGTSVPVPQSAPARATPNPQTAVPTPAQPSTATSTPRPATRPIQTPVVRQGTPIPARTPIVVGNTGRTTDN